MFNEVVGAVADVGLTAEDAQPRLVSDHIDHAAGRTLAIEGALRSPQHFQMVHVHQVHAGRDVVGDVDAVHEQGHARLGADVLGGLVAHASDGDHPLQAIVARDRQRRHLRVQIDERHHVGLGQGGVGDRAHRHRRLLHIDVALLGGHHDLLQRLGRGRWRGLGMGLRGAKGSEGERRGGRAIVECSTKVHGCPSFRCPVGGSDGQRRRASEANLTRNAAQPRQSLGDRARKSSSASFVINASYTDGGYMCRIDTRQRRPLGKAAICLYRGAIPLLPDRDAQLSVHAPHTGRVDDGRRPRWTMSGMTMADI